MDFLDGTGLWTVGQSEVIIPPEPPVQVQQGPHLRQGHPVSPRMRRLIMRGLFLEEISELEEEELRIILLALDLFDD